MPARDSFEVTPFNHPLDFTISGRRRASGLSRVRTDVVRCDSTPRRRRESRGTRRKQSAGTRRPLCSANLADESAFFDKRSRTRYDAPLFMDGEEVADGRAWAHTLPGTSYQLAGYGACDALLAAKTEHDHGTTRRAPLRQAPGTSWARRRSAAGWREQCCR